MSEFAWLALYSFLVLLVSLGGGCLPLLGQITHNRLQYYLSAAAGVMLGAAFFHVMPDAFEMAGEYFGLWISVGVVGIFCIERFIAPHSHESEGEHAHHHHHEGEHDCKEEKKETGILPQPPAGKEQHRAAPAVGGWMAVLGLTIHTFMNGVGLAGAVDAAFLAPGQVVQILPGLAMFLAIVLHKPADALAISVVLSRKGVARRRIGLVQLGFALMVPAGAAVYYQIQHQIGEGPDAKHWERQLAGAALAFSAGTFLLIALSDLLPEVQFHRHDRVPLFLTLISGLVLMGGIAFLEDHGREHDQEQPAGKLREGGRSGEDKTGDRKEAPPPRGTRERR